MPTPSPKSAQRMPCGRPRPTQPPKTSVDPGWRERFAAHLERRKLRNSLVRWKIAEIALSTGDHLSAQDLTHRVRRRHPEIGMATVYRTLKLLAEAQVLRESLQGRKEGGIYEPLAGDHHDHVVCLDCNEIFEFHDVRIETAQDAVTERMRFRPVSHQHVVYARCDYHSSHSLHSDKARE